MSFLIILYHKWFWQITDNLQTSKTPEIFGDHWEAKVKPEPLRKFTPTTKDNVPTVKYTVVGEGGDDDNKTDSSVRFPEEHNFYR